MRRVNKNVDAEQAPLNSPNITAPIIKLLDGAVLVASVFVPCEDTRALNDA